MSRNRALYTTEPFLQNKPTHTPLRKHMFLNYFQNERHAHIGNIHIYATCQKNCYSTNSTLRIVRVRAVVLKYMALSIYCPHNVHMNAINVNGSQWWGQQQLKKTNDKRRAFSCLQQGNSEYLPHIRKLLFASGASFLLEFKWKYIPLLNKIMFSGTAHCANDVLLQAQARG